MKRSLPMFDNADVPAGPSAYAEHFAADTFLKMPANALVNLGYLLAGGYWLYLSLQPRIRARGDAGYFLAFASLALLYGPLQFVRIVTQARAAGIADQWLTLPFFALVIAWNLRVQGRASLAAPLLTVSVLSYFLAAVHPRGFELALALHIAGAVATAVPTLRRSGRGGARNFALAVVCCALFVGLKKADFVLAEVGLTRFTGHFWSKVADFLQIHFAAAFFLKTEPASWPKSVSSSLVPARPG